jgi:hypothetical protein
MSNRTAATILGMMHGNLVIMRPSGMTVETIRFHLKACVAILHPTLWPVPHGVLKALILAPPYLIPKAAVVPRREKKFSLNLNLYNHLMLLKCLRCILLLFLQRRRKSLLLRKKGRKGARGRTLKSPRRKVLQRE